MGPAQICSFVIGDACDDTYNPIHEWEVAFPPEKKPPVKPPVPPQEGVPTFKVLHISDTHYDPYYQEGTNADCNEPLCCRLTNGPPRSSATAAGRWGDYRKCDTPKRTVEHMLKHIADTHSVSEKFIDALLVLLLTSLSIENNFSFFTSFFYCGYLLYRYLFWCVIFSRFRFFSKVKPRVKKF